MKVNDKKLDGTFECPEVSGTLRWPGTLQAEHKRNEIMDGIYSRIRSPLRGSTQSLTPMSETNVARRARIHDHGGGHPFPKHGKRPSRVLDAIAPDTFCNVRLDSPTRNGRSLCPALVQWGNVCLKPAVPAQRPAPERCRDFSKFGPIVEPRHSGERSRVIKLENWKWHDPFGQVRYRFLLFPLV
jgi:hypothetical protein